MTAPAPGAAFWSFALAAYDRPPVRDACLRLQDDHALDVMVLLGCLWAAQRGIQLDAGQVGAVVAAVAPWQSRVTGRLRKARRAARTIAGEVIESGPLRAAILGAERRAERVTAELVAAALAGAVPRSPAETPAALALFNLGLYFDRAGCRAEQAEVDRQTLVRAEFPPA